MKDNDVLFNFLQKNHQTSDPNDYIEALSKDCLRLTVPA